MNSCFEVILISFQKDQIRKKNKKKTKKILTIPINQLAKLSPSLFLTLSSTGRQTPVHIQACTQYHIHVNHIINEKSDNQKFTLKFFFYSLIILLINTSFSHSAILVTRNSHKPHNKVTGLIIWKTAVRRKLQ